MQVGLREANQHFSKIVREVREGKTVLLTERGRPFARIVPGRRSRSTEEEAAIQKMVKEGLLRPAEKPGVMPYFKPIRVRSKVTTTQILREERDAR